MRIPRETLRLAYWKVCHAIGCSSEKLINDPKNGDEHCQMILDACSDEYNDVDPREVGMACIAFRKDAKKHEDNWAPFGGKGPKKEINPRELGLCKKCTDIIYKFQNENSTKQTVVEQGGFL